MDKKALSVKILGTGTELPRRRTSSEEIDRRLGLSPGTLQALSGVEFRHEVSDDESNSGMGAVALLRALKAAKLEVQELDAIVFGGGSCEQIIPSTAVLIQRQLGASAEGIPSFDVNSTCLSFVTGLDLCATLIASGRYRHIGLVSSEIATRGLNWKHLESASLFGDGAAAAVLGPTPTGETSAILAARMETFASGSKVCEIEGGGTRLHARNHKPGQEDERFLFSMDGRKAFRISAEKMPGLISALEAAAGVRVPDLDWVIPHQASAAALELIRRKIGIRKERWVEIFRDHGNCIAASIPLAIDRMVTEGRLKRGQRVLLLGTSAGISLGGVILEY